MITLVNGWYVDENNNRWACAGLETAESAEAKSKTLIACSDCSGCRDCCGCCGCCGCSGCRGCRDCSCCRDYAENPQRVVSKKIGSRESQTTIYWVGENVQVVCGCFHGNIAEFRNAVSKKHHATKHEDEYLKFINAVCAYMETSK